MTDRSPPSDDGRCDEVDAANDLDRPMATLVIGLDDWNAMLDQAKTGSSAEVCGVLGGTFSDDRSRVESIYPAENAASDSRRRYRLDPEELFAILETIDDRGEDVVGFYHSHPAGPSKPSPVDVESATWPDRSYVIVSLEPTVEVTSWRWRTGDEPTRPTDSTDDSAPPSHDQTDRSGEPTDRSKEPTESPHQSPDVVESSDRSDGWFEREQIRLD